MTKFNISRVTGLDPANPCYSGIDKVGSLTGLTKTDATFVDIVHTNAGILGMQEPIGHVDLYFNDGKTQPGCYLNIKCSHERALEFYAQSIIDERKFTTEICSESSNINHETSCKRLPMGFAINSNYPEGTYNIVTPMKYDAEGVFMHSLMISDRDINLSTILYDLKKEGILERASAKALTYKQQGGKIMGDILNKN